MKKIFLTLLLCVCTLHAARQVQSINKLVKCEAIAGTYSSQIILEFQSFLAYYGREESKIGEQIKLYFPSIPLADFHALRVVEQIKQLPVVKEVSVVVEKLPMFSRLVVTLTFQKDSVFVKLTKMEDPNYLMLDIFDRSTLKEIGKKVHILQACNTIGCPRLSKKKRVAFAPENACIVIDAGHGGMDPGARAFGSSEKTFTLEIAKRVYANLKQHGNRVFLTRTADKTLSVVDRFQFAQQLIKDKEGVFVSIHANAAPGLPAVSGFETHVLDEHLFSGDHGSSTFLLLKSNEADKHFRMMAEKMLYQKITHSKTLAVCIQKNIRKCLYAKNFNAENRGVKGTAFRTLLHSEVPASIVEVGFMTNKNECNNLSKREYRDLLALGISNGIKQFLASAAPVQRELAL